MRAVDFIPRIGVTGEYPEKFIFDGCLAF